MIFGLILYILLALLFFILGMLLWKKQKITLIHTYHYKNVKRNDIPAYTRLMGMALIFIGVGCFVAGILALFNPNYSTLAICLGIIVGIITIHKAQKKYNGSWFS